MQHVVCVESLSLLLHSLTVSKRDLCFFYCGDSLMIERISGEPNYIQNILPHFINW